MESLSPKIQDLIKAEAIKQNFKNFDIKVTSGSNKGDGYLSEVRAIQITERNIKKTLNLILKVASPSVEFRKNFPIRNAFLREIYIYEKVMPEFFEFQEKHKISNVFKEIPKYYGSINKEFQEAILLQNLKLDGYKIGNRKKPMNEDHLKMVLTAYAKFHAITLAMKTLEPRKFENITKVMKESVFDKKGVQNFSHMVFKDTLDVFKDNPKTSYAIKKYMKELTTMLFKDVKAEENHLVICHSDCWAPNYMFKYEDPYYLEKPTNICIIDWQLSQYSLVVSDISYFLLISGSKEALQNYKDYLSVYYETLRTQLVAFGCDAEEVYSRKDFENHWKKYCKMGLFNVVIMLRQAVADQGTESIDKQFEEGKSLLDRELDNIDVFNKRMEDIVNFLLDNDFL